MTTVLITGGAGFIGSHIAERFIQEGHVVKILDDFSTGSESNLYAIRDKIQIIKGNILDYETVRGSVAGCQVVVHLASKISVPESVANPSEYMAIMVTGSANVLDASLKAGVRRVVMASSAAVYGTEIEPPHTESMTSSFRASPYAVGKQAMEELGKEFHKRGLPCVSLRLFNVFGPRQRADSGYAAAIPAFMDACIKEENPIIYGDGTQTRDFTYVGNVAEAFLRAAFLPGVGGIYNVGGGKGVTVTDLCNTIISISGKNVHPVYAQERPGDLKHSHADMMRTLKGLGLREIDTVPEGLKKTWQWRAGVGK